MSDLSVRELDDPVGDCEHARVMGGKEKRRLARLVQPAEEEQKVLRRLGVEVRGGLVGEHDLGIGDHRARDGDPLLLTAGKL